MNDKLRLRTVYETEPTIGARRSRELAKGDQK